MRENDKKIISNGVLGTFRKSITPRSSWANKDEFLDVVYWIRQLVGLLTGIILGIIPITGAYGISLFFAVNCAFVYFYSSTFQIVDEEEFGGYSEIIKEGLMTCFATFLVVWIVIYDTIYGLKFLRFFKYGKPFCIKLWKTVSRSRDVKSSILRGITDGCKCWITLTSSGDTPLVISKNAQIEPGKSFKVCFRVGQAPDQDQNLRGVIEKSLMALGLGSSTVLEVTPDEQSSVHLTVNLDGFSAPQSFNPTPVNDEEEEKNQPLLENKKDEREEETKENEENSSNLAWRASYSRLWFARADALKNRGSLLFNALQVTEAFACYSRALQLLTLLGVSFGLADKAQQEEGEKHPCEENFGVVNAEGYFDLDAESPFTVDPDQIELSAALIEKMHFSLLSNMALCQLKADCPSSAAKLCSKALEMAPSDEILLSPDSEECDETRISRKDVEKVLYRRATACLQMEEYEAGIRDTERLLKLDSSNTASNKLSRELILALRAHNTALAKKMKKAFQ